jgi:hypothetical protein
MLFHGISCGRVDPTTALNRRRLAGTPSIGEMPTYSHAREIAAVARWNTPDRVFGVCSSQIVGFSCGGARPRVDDEPVAARPGFNNGG